VGFSSDAGSFSDAVINSFKNLQNLGELTTSRTCIKRLPFTKTQVCSRQLK
jgi:hypothetical protein